MRSRRRFSAALLLVAVVASSVSTSHAQGALGKIKKAIGAKAPKIPPVKVPTPTVAGAPTAGAPAAAGAAATSGSVAQGLNAKVTETLMGPTVTLGLMSPTVMSEDGDHLAVVAAKGSRQLVLLDGVEGPLFDEIPLNFTWSQSHQGTGSIVFSPTGGHSAYLGRRAGDFIAVVDGKEAVTLTTTAAVNNVATRGWAFMFSRDGSRLAYGAQDAPGVWVMIVDGVKSAPYAAIDFSQAFLKGKRLVYVAQTADQQWHAVVDGKPGPGYAGISSLQVTPDGAHHAYLATPQGGKTVAVVDGIESKGAGLGVQDVELAPDGRLAYVAWTVAPRPNVDRDRDAKASLFVGGQALPGICDCPTFSNRLAGGITTARRHVAWSPDGKGFAYVQSNRPAPGVTVIVNGKPMGPTYQVVSELRWSPDGTRFAYLGTSPSGFFQVIDGQEFEALHDVPQFQWSPDSKRYAFQGKNSFVVDGKEQPKVGYLLESGRFSSDSKHFAYASMAGNNRAVVDGEVKPFYLGGFQQTSQAQPYITFPPLVFSPDGARLAYIGSTLDATGRVNSQAGMVLDGVRAEWPNQGLSFPSWSPDGKHFAAMAWNGRGVAAMIDGKVGSVYETVLQNNAAACRFVDGHTFRFYGTKAGQIYRVTLDIS